MYHFETMHLETVCTMKWSKCFHSCLFSVSSCFHLFYIDRCELNWNLLYVL